MEVLCFHFCPVVLVDYQRVTMWDIPRPRLLLPSSKLQLQWSWKMMLLLLLLLALNRRGKGDFSEKAHDVLVQVCTVEAMVYPSRMLQGQSCRDDFMNELYLAAHTASSPSAVEFGWSGEDNERRKNLKVKRPGAVRFKRVQAAKERKIYPK